MGAAVADLLSRPSGRRALTGASVMVLGMLAVWLLLHVQVELVTGPRPAPPNAGPVAADGTYVAPGFR